MSVLSRIQMFSSLGLRCSVLTTPISLKRSTMPSICLLKECGLWTLDYGVELDVEQDIVTLKNTEIL